MPEESRELFEIDAPAQIKEAFERISTTMLNYVIDRLKRDIDSLKSLYELISVEGGNSIEIRIGAAMSHRCTKESYIGRAVLSLARERRLIGLQQISSLAMLDELVIDPREVIRRMTYPALVTSAAYMHMVVINHKGYYQGWQGDPDSLIIPLERMREEISARHLDSQFAAVLTAKASQYGYI